MTRADVLRSVLHKPYVEGATGPDAFDCLGLVQHLSRALYGVEVPTDGEAIRRARKSYRRALVPSDGSIVMMRDANNHVGLWLAPECGIIHAVEHRGVIFETPQAVYFGGFGRPRYFTRHDKAPSRHCETPRSHGQQA